MLDDNSLAPLPISKPKGWAASKPIDPKDYPPPDPKSPHRPPRKSVVMGKGKTALALRGRFIAKALAEGKSPTEALVSVGYSPNNVERKTEQIFNQPIIKKTIAEIFDKAGLTDDFIAEQLRELATAKKKLFFATQGKVTDEREIADSTTRLAALALTSKVKGLVIDKSVNLNVNSEYSPVDLSKYLTEANTLDAEFDVSDQPPK